jgi:hypothetical protein
MWKEGRYERVRIWHGRVRMLGIDAYVSASISSGWQSGLIS